jgi:GntR family transcriptional repressor for pyruvate dehydrogenase complex
VRQPRIAEMVAAILRGRILDGTLADGDLLARQEDLLDEFSVSKPSLREALRILEAEGLITVQRGNIGGSVVHLPKATNVAYTLSLFLQSNNVPLADVGAALRHLEPVCAALCAERTDRKRVVVPTLRQVQQESVDAVDDELAFTLNARRFHEQLVLGCGNETMIVVAGALESVWAAHVKAWARRATESGAFPAPAQRKLGLKAHERIITLIEQGDVSGVSLVVRRHLAESQLPPLGHDVQFVQASVLSGASTLFPF